MLMSLGPQIAPKLFRGHALSRSGVKSLHTAQFCLRDFFFCQAFLEICLRKDACSVGDSFICVFFVVFRA